MNEDFPTLTPFEHTFDYGKTVEQLLAEGEYEGFVDHGHITQNNFPVTERGVVTRKGDLAHFGKNMSEAAVDAWCVAHNKRRGTAHETLTIGAADKQLQREHSVVSGQGVRIYVQRSVLYLRGWSNNQREVYIRWFEDTIGWSPSCRFVVFDIEPQPA